MLKQHRNSPEAASVSSVYQEERPRKKLSFREPEVVPQTPNGVPLSAPPVGTNHEGSLKGRHLLTRPHSISGVFGLSGLSNASSPTRRPVSTGSAHPPPSPLPQLRNYLSSKITSTNHINKSFVDRGWENRICEETSTDCPSPQQTKSGTSQNNPLRSPLTQRHHKGSDHPHSAQKPPSSSKSSHHSRPSKHKKDEQVPSPGKTNTSSSKKSSSRSSDPNSMMRPKSDDAHGARSKSEQRRRRGSPDSLSNSVSLEDLSLDVSNGLRRLNPGNPTQLNNYFFF